MKIRFTRVFYSVYRPSRLFAHKWSSSDSIKCGFTFNVDLPSYLGSMCKAVLIGWDPAKPPLSPALPAYLSSYTRTVGGRYWSAKIDDLFVTPCMIPTSAVRRIRTIRTVLSIIWICVCVEGGGNKPPGPYRPICKIIAYSISSPYLPCLPNTSKPRTITIRGQGAA